MKKELAVKNLREVKGIFDKVGIKYWLDWGTLLGAVREGKIIEWDYDIDLGTMDDNFDKIVSAISILKKSGFDVHLIKINYKNFSGKSFCLYRFGCAIDVDVYQIKGENAFAMGIGATNLISRGFAALYLSLLYPRPGVTSKWKFVVKVLDHCLSLLPPKSKKSLSGVAWRAWMQSNPKFSLVVVPKHYFEKLGDIKFHGMTFNIPSNAESYLKNKYGEDWKTPKKEWATSMYRDLRVLTAR